MTQTARSFPWPLAVLPLLEVAFFAAACALVEEHALLAMTSLVAAALGHCFAVHVFFHECIHYGAGKPLPRSLQFVATLAMGMPLDGYRVHHLNHHQHGNGAKDFSTTWHFAGERRVARSVVSYVLGWPRQSVAAGKFIRRQALSTTSFSEIARRIRMQRTLLAVAIALLFAFSWKFALLYLGLIYLGWAAVALQNYGQHMPTASNEATTWTHPLYNRLLFNNGLHFEHHAHPELPWHALSAEVESPRIHSPHLLHPIMRAPRKETLHG